ncbi:MAG: OmpA family protein [Pseudomonadota bacterium]
MTVQPLVTRRYVILVGYLVVPALLVGCASMELRTGPKVARAENSASSYRIAQLDHGDASYFGMCLVPICPGVTTKTLRVQGDPVAQHHPVAMAKSPAPPAAAPSTLVVHFPTGSAVLGFQDARRLTHWSAQALRAERITVAGRTDNVGGEALNQHLASARARAVADYLRDHLGIAPARMAWEGRGKCCYLNDNATMADRQANRRSEITRHTVTEERP